MDSQGDDGKWKDDFYITQFLELLLKYRHECSEKDATESDRILEYFHNFDEGLTEYDIKRGLKKVRELYTKEALKLKKARKSDNESKPPWFCTAESLFYNTVPWDDEILRDQMINSVSTCSPVSTIGVELVSFQYEQRKRPPLPPKPMLISSKNATVTPVRATFSILPAIITYLQYVTTPFLPTKSKCIPINAGKYGRRRQKFSKSVSTATKPLIPTPKRFISITAEFVTVGSPFVMNTNSSKVNHPFNPPASPVPRISLFPITTSFGAQLTTNFVFTSAESCLPPALIIRNGTNLSRSEVPRSVTGALCSTQDPCSTIITYSLDKCPIFTTAVSPRIRLSSSPYTPEVPLPQVAPASKFRNSHRPNANILPSTAPSSRAERDLWPRKHPPPYRENTHISSDATFSRSSVRKSVFSSPYDWVLERTALSSSERLV